MFQHPAPTNRCATQGVQLMPREKAASLTSAALMISANSGPERLRAPRPLHGFLPSDRTNSILEDRAPGEVVVPPRPTSFDPQSRLPTPSTPEGAAADVAPGTVIVAPSAVDSATSPGIPDVPVANISVDMCSRTPPPAEVPTVGGGIGSGVEPRFFVPCFTASSASL